MKVLDLFAGAGGMSLGFELAGFDVVAAVEVDPIHCATHKINFPNCNTICADVKNVNASDIADNIDVVCGGSPCQGFSLIGKRILEDPRNYLIYHYVRLIKELQPKYFIFENVKGLTMGAHAKFLESLISELQAIGYNIRLPYRVLNAADYGVPQNRHRLFLLGAKEGLPVPEYPKPFASKVTVWEAIHDLADSVDTPPTIHSEEVQRRFATTEQGKVEPISRFYKLQLDGQCNTLRAGTDSSKGSHTAVRPIHPFLPRVITVKEAARLHSYPDSFKFSPVKWHALRQIGNSVPPLLAKVVAGGFLL
jgi:DNA (cytosine-5)-methyltransferase 1